MFLQLCHRFAQLRNFLFEILVVSAGLGPHTLDPSTLRGAIDDGCREMGSRKDKGIDSHERLQRQPRLELF
jgi:hypothetical protein